MSAEIIAATIAALVAVVSAVISVYGQARVTQFADRLAQRREAESRGAQTLAFMSKYRDPLLRATIDLQSRLFNIHRNRFLIRAAGESEAYQAYAVQNTLFVIAEYFGWVEVMRREVQFLDLGDIEANRRLSELLLVISKAFGHMKMEPIFRLFHGEQRALGEIMLTTRPTETHTSYECIGYARFIDKLDEPSFARWFTQLEADIKTLMQSPDLHCQRIVAVHSGLMDLIDFLDPNCVRFPLKYRSRLG
jgi:hypothetical protein